MFIVYLVQMMLVGLLFGYMADKALQGDASWSTYGLLAYLFGLIIYCATKMADEDK